jgi:hypothetical protein
MLLSLAQAPPSASWRPQVSSTMVNSTLPRADISFDPVVRKMFFWWRMVSCAL